MEHQHLVKPSGTCRNVAPNESIPSETAISSANPPTSEPPLCPDFSHLHRNDIEHVFSFLDSPRDLALSAAVSRQWRLATSTQPWETFYLARWHAPAQHHPHHTLAGPDTSDATTAAPTATWQTAFSNRMALARSFRKGRPATDRLTGHQSGVKVAHILGDTSRYADTNSDVAENMLLTGSVDRRLRLWDLERGTHVAASSPHAGTVRCLAIDENMLVTGSSDHRMRVWRRSRGSFHKDGSGRNENASLDARPSSVHQRRRSVFPFQLDGERAVVHNGHTGPVSALQLTPTCLISGSWDYTVRLWQRRSPDAMYHEYDDENENDGGRYSEANNGEADGNNNAVQLASPPPFGDDDEEHATPAGWPVKRCLQILHFDDWVTSMALKKNSERLFVAAGQDAHVVDLGQGGGLRKIASLRRHATPASVTAVEASLDGRTLFYSTAEGGIYAVDLRAPISSSPPGSSDMGDDGQQPPVLFDPGFSCSSAVTGLSWDFPWLAASLQNGELLLLDAEMALAGYSPARSRARTNAGSARSRSGRSAARRHASSSTSILSSSWNASSSRVLAAGIPGGAQCVNVSGRWVVAGYESGVVATWDFSKAEEAARVAQEMRESRRRARLVRREAAAAREAQRKAARAAAASASFLLPTPFVATTMATMTSPPLLQGGGGSHDAGAGAGRMAAKGGGTEAAERKNESDVDLKISSGGGGDGARSSNEEAGLGNEDLVADGEGHVPLQRSATTMRQTTATYDEPTTSAAATRHQVDERGRHTHSEALHIPRCGPPKSGGVGDAHPDAEEAVRLKARSAPSSYCEYSSAAQARTTRHVDQLHAPQDAMNPHAWSPSSSRTGSSFSFSSEEDGEEEYASSAYSDFDADPDEKDATHMEYSREYTHINNDDRPQRQQQSSARSLSMRSYGIGGAQESSRGNLDHDGRRHHRRAASAGMTPPGSSLLRSSRPHSRAPAPVPLGARRPSSEERGSRELPRRSSWKVLALPSRGVSGSGSAGGGSGR